MPKKIIIDKSELRKLIENKIYNHLLSLIKEDKELDLYEKYKSDQSFRFTVTHLLAKKGYLVHGTNESFDLFDFGRFNRFKDGYGIYFTSDSYKAEEYGNEFMFVNSNGLKIVDVDKTFDDYNIDTPNSCVLGIKWCEDKLEDVRTNREYDQLNNQIDYLKNQLNNVMLKDISYETYKILKSDDYQVFYSGNKIKNCISYGINRLPSQNGMKDISIILRNLGIDGYKYDNIYVFINFEKVNEHLVKDKNKLISSVLNQ